MTDAPHPDVATRDDDADDAFGDRHPSLLFLLGLAAAVVTSPG